LVSMIGARMLARFARGTTSDGLRVTGYE
jgi:hypothetical protein